MQAMNKHGVVQMCKQYTVKLVVSTQTMYK